ncbi:MAG: efflux RND transporter periplasmic adaptor subunit [Proteobacteria bacterium]|nr:efflux RND transporter periplasmic adaptor subunit [Pseudomonadota bacterium]
MRCRAVSSLCLAALLTAGCAGAPDAADRSVADAIDRSVPVTVTTVQARSLVRTLELGGVAQASRSARLVPIGQGVVVRLPVKLGDDVARGALLAELDTSTARLQLAQAQSSLDVGRLQLNDAEREADRARTLTASGALPQASLDQAESGLLLARAQLAQGEASLAVLQSQVGQARLTAPFAGTVTGVFLEEGEFFSPAPSMSGPPALVALDALDELQLDVHIPDVDLSLVSEGMPVEVVAEAFPDRTFPGDIVLVGATANTGARTFLVRVRIANPDQVLRPGLFLTARVELERKEGIVVVPQDAIAMRAGEEFVMVLDGERARQTTVTPGLRGDDGVEISGIEPGARLLVDGQFGLPDGSLVRVVGER